MNEYNQNPSQNYDRSQTPQTQAGQPLGQQLTLPNSTIALVMGILSLVASCGFIGFILGIVGLVLANKDLALYRSAAPGTYTQSSYSNANAGRICSIIGIILSAVVVVIALFYLLVFGALATSALTM